MPEISEVVNQRIDVLFDGGIRRGSDIFKAYALGANAVMLGRPVLWALASGGREHLKMMLLMLQDEFERTMRSAGCKNLSEVRKFKSQIDIERPR